MLTLLTILIYLHCFRRFDTHRLSEFGCACKRLRFRSGKRWLQGYLFGEGESLVVIAAGLGNSASHYSPQIRYFVNAGRRVFAFDYTGTYESEGGSCRGFPQALEDLRAAVAFLRRNQNFGSRILLLFGHSMGGYAVCSILSECNADAAVSVGGINSAMEATISGAYHFLGRAAFLHYPFLYCYQALRFGRARLRREAVEGAQRARALLLVNGLDDWIAPLNRASVVSHVAQITNPKVQCLLWGEKGRDGHANLLFSADENEANAMLMQKIDHFFDHAVRENEKNVTIKEKSC